MQNLIIEPTVGYMLKVKKSGVTITKYKDEFDAIRHGNYYDFVNLVDGPTVEFIAVWNAGNISTDPSIQTDDCDMVRLFKVGPSLRQFYQQCRSEYGNIVDNDVSDEIFEKVALFEIALRMHANNKLIKERQDLIDVIKILGQHNNLPQVEIDKLHQGRIFINMIKHFKNQFPSWNEGISGSFEKTSVYSYLIKVKVLEGIIPMNFISKN